MSKPSKRKQNSVLRLLFVWCINWMLFLWSLCNHFHFTLCCDEISDIFQICWITFLRLTSENFDRIIISHNFPLAARFDNKNIGFFVNPRGKFLLHQKTFYNASWIQFGSSECLRLPVDKKMKPTVRCEEKQKPIYGNVKALKKEKSFFTTSARWIILSFWCF